MAALAVCTISVLYDLCEFSNALVRTRFDLRRALRYVRAKKRLKLFRYYCRVLWSQSGDTVDSGRTVTKRSIGNPMNLTRPTEMERMGIDFAAIEASAEAYEVIDTFAASPARRRQQPHQYHPYDNQAETDLDNIEIISGVEVEAAFYEYVDAHPVYTDKEIGPLKEGTSVIVSGHIQRTCERFSINFIIENESRDIVLHVNPRLPQNYIVRNSKVRGTWGHEEVSSPLPFSLHRGTHFDIEILTTSSCFMIAVNGYHFIEYAHRLPYTRVQTLEVKGDVSDVSVKREEVLKYPSTLAGAKPKLIQTVRIKEYEITTPEYSASNSQSESEEAEGPPTSRSANRLRDIVPLVPSKIREGLPMPYCGKLPLKSLTSGCCVTMKGRIKLLPHSFYINLQTGHQVWPHPNIAFHFNPRFSKNVGAIGQAIVCRNAWYNNGWGEEERSQLATDLRPGKVFTLTIACTDDAFEVYVDHKFIIDFKYKISPETVDTVYIQGDLRLWDLGVHKSKSTT